MAVFKSCPAPNPAPNPAPPSALSVRFICMQGSPLEDREPKLRVGDGGSLITIKIKRLINDDSLFTKFNKAYKAPGSPRIMDSTMNKTSSGAGWFTFGLGWLSVVLGLIGLFAPRRAARTIGIRNHPFLFRLFGLRELASGYGILTQQQRPKARSGWLWSRVGGDALDLTLLGTAFRSSSRRNRLGIATGAVAGVTILDTLGALLSMEGKPVHAIRNITIHREPKELYDAWRNLSNIPHFMANIQEVTPIDSTHSHWVAKAPGGMPIEWDSEITEEIPEKRIAWRTTENAQVAHSGAVQFTPAEGGRGTVVQVTLDYTPPAGKLGTLGANVASVFGQAPEQQMEADLHRFKQWIETGYVTTTEGQPAGGSQRSSSSAPIG